MFQSIAGTKNYFLVLFLLTILSPSKLSLAKLSPSKLSPSKLSQPKLSPSKLAATPVVQQGFIDVRTSDIDQNRISLRGSWFYFENQLLSPQEVIHAPKTFLEFPKAWNETRVNGLGYGTYAIYILAPKEINSLALELPQIYSSYQLWVNGQSMASNGKVGKTAEETVPQWMPQTVSFENSGDTIQVVLQIANFHHHLGGSKDPIYLGSSELLQGHRHLSVTANLAESALLALLAIGFLITYFTLSTRKKVIMYFALLCLTWSVRVGFSNLYIFISFIPDFDWHSMVRIEYATLFLTMIWSILFLSRVFVKEENKIFRYFLVGCNCIFIAFTLIAAPTSFTRWITVYLTFCAILLVYSAVIVLRAWINQRTGSTYLTISILLGLLVFSYDVYAYEGFSTYNPIIFSAGYMTIFSLMGIVLLKHLNIIKSSRQSISILTYKDLYK